MALLWIRLGKYGKVTGGFIVPGQLETSIKTRTVVNLAGKGTRVASLEAHGTEAAHVTPPPEQVQQPLPERIVENRGSAVCKTGSRHSRMHPG